MEEGALYWLLQYISLSVVSVVPCHSGWTTNNSSNGSWFCSLCLHALLDVWFWLLNVFDLMATVFQVNFNAELLVVLWNGRGLLQYDELNDPE